MMLTSIEGQVGQAESGGLSIPVRLDLVEGAKIGDYAIVHAGFAITLVEPEEAQETLSILQRMAEVGAEMDAQGEESP